MYQSLNQKIHSTLSRAGTAFAVRDRAFAASNFDISLDGQIRFSCFAFMNFGSPQLFI